MLPGNKLIKGIGGLRNIWAYAMSAVALRPCGVTDVNMERSCFQRRSAGDTRKLRE